MVQKIESINGAKSNRTFWADGKIRSFLPMALCFGIWIAAVLYLIFHNRIGIDDVEMIVLLTIQLVSSITDLHNKTISLKLMLLGIIIGFACSVFFSGVYALKDHILGGSVAFLVMAILMIAFKRQIGGGDLWLMTVTGFFAGMYYYFSVLFVAIILAGIYSLLLVIIKKASKKTQIPFAPFVLFATVICTLSIN